MNANTLKFCRAAHSFGMFALAKSIVTSERVATGWWNVSFLVFLFAAMAAPQAIEAAVLFVASVLNLFYATRHRKVVERKNLKE